MRLACALLSHCLGNAVGTGGTSDVLKHVELLQGKYKVPVIAVAPPKFEPTDPEALKYLDENGYVVFSAAAAKDEVTRAIDLFWTHVETESKGKVRQQAYYDPTQCRADKARRPADMER